MSDDEITIYGYGVPTGRQLEGPSGRKGYLGTVGTLRPFTPELGALLRKRLRELDPDKLEQHGKVFTDTTGEEFTIARDFTDPIDPASTGVEAFFVTPDNLVVYLRPRGAVQKPEIVELGEMRGGRA